MLDLLAEALSEIQTAARSSSPPESGRGQLSLELSIERARLSLITSVLSTVIVSVYY